MKEQWENDAGTMEHIRRIFAERDEEYRQKERIYRERKESLCRQETACEERKKQLIDEAYKNALKSIKNIKWV